MTSRARVGRLGIPLLLSALLGAGCGDGGHEAQLKQASRDLAAAHEEVDEAEVKFEQAEEKLAEARKVAKVAEKELDAARKRLAEAEASVDLTATDAALFRIVQRRLLEDEDLEEVAIRAEVERGVVTLIGSVPGKAIRDRAVKIARETPGVVRVDERIEVLAASK